MEGKERDEQREREREIESGAGLERSAKCACASLFSRSLFVSLLLSPCVCVGEEDLVVDTVSPTDVIEDELHPRDDVILTLHLHLTQTTHLAVGSNRKQDKPRSPQSPFPESANPEVRNPNHLVESAVQPKVPL